MQFCLDVEQNEMAFQVAYRSIACFRLSVMGRSILKKIPAEDIRSLGFGIRFCMNLRHIFAFESRMNFITHQRHTSFILTTT